MELRAPLRAAFKATVFGGRDLVTLRVRRAWDDGSHHWAPYLDWELEADVRARLRGP